MRCCCPLGSDFVCYHPQSRLVFVAATLLLCSGCILLSFGYVHVSPLPAIHIERVSLELPPNKNAAQHPHQGPTCLVGLGELIEPTAFNNRAQGWGVYNLESRSRLTAVERSQGVTLLSSR